VLADEFIEFLTHQQRHLDRRTTYRLIAAHGRYKERLHYATLCEDWERVVALHLQQHDATAALRVLEQLATASDGATDWALVRLLESYSCELIDAAPLATLNLWRRVTALDPVRMLPAIMRYHESVIQRAASGEVHEGIRYLSQLTDVPPLVRDTLVLLHAQHSDTSTLLAFLANDHYSYSADYALRICRENRRMEACVLLLQVRGSYQEALTCALCNNMPELARQTANAAPHGDDELRRRLWLQVLASTAETSLSVHDCMRILAEGAAGSQRDGSPLLRLEHALPLLDEFVVLNDLKELVCESLATHAASCAELRKILDGGVGRATILKGEIRALCEAQPEAAVNDNGASATCATCHGSADDLSMFFPCGHMWHTQCLQASNGNGSAACPLCSDAIVECIEDPFVSAGEAF